MNATLESKKNRLFVILSGIFLTNALVAEIIGGKIFSLEATLGIPPVHIPLFGSVWDFNLTAGVLIWPMVFITTDLINEYFGKPGVKRISFLTAGLIAYAFVAIYVSMKVAPADWWIEANQSTPSGNSFDVNYAFQKIMGQGLRIIIASLIAFLIGQLVDVFVFQILRRRSGSKMLWLRATGSTLVSQFVDSFIVLGIAFYNIFTFKQIMAIGLTNYLYKFIVAIALTPLIYLGHYWIDQYLGKENALKLSDEATQKSDSFF